MTRTIAGIIKTTHVEVSTDFTQPIIHIPLNNDNIGYLESYDFSRANMSEESRIACISTVASVCYGNPNASGSISLYNRLANESAGLPSSSFEFVPVLLDRKSLSAVYEIAQYGDGELASCIKYGEVLEFSDKYLLLTNLRALMADIGDRADNFYNTPDECAIIAKYHRVFKAKIDIATRTQYIRHRVSWQELSRRYVSGKRDPFEFYISYKLEEVTHNHNPVENIIEKCVDIYDYAIEQGVKPEEARRILPQAMYTTIWSAWLPSQLESFYTLRLDAHAQSEIRELAQAMKTATPDKYLKLIRKEMRNN